MDMILISIDLMSYEANLTLTDAFHISKIFPNVIQSSVLNLIFHLSPLCRISSLNLLTFYENIYQKWDSFAWLGVNKALASSRILCPVAALDRDEQGLWGPSSAFSVIGRISSAHQHRSRLLILLRFLTNLCNSQLSTVAER